MLLAGELAKSKWKHLRDNFRNELKKTYRGKQSSDGGSPSGIEHESKWVWFKNLQFLRDQMNSRVIGCNINQPSHYASSLDETHIEPQIDILEGDGEAHFDDLVDGDSCQSMLTGDDVIQQSGIPIRKRGRMSRKRVLIDPLDDYQGIERKRYEVIQRRVTCHDDNDDDTYHFLMSVRSPMRSLPLERQMYVRLKIQELILNEITSLQQDSKLHHPATSNSEGQNCSPQPGNPDYFQS